jgi:coenzyme F420-reducing hydrogenase beta subunit
VSIRPFELFDLDETENETSAEQELYSKLDELMKAYRFRVETELGKKYEKQIKELRELKNELEKRCDEQTSKVSDLNTKFVNAAAEATNCQTQLTATEAELKRVKYINEKNIKFKEKLVDHLNEQLQILSSEMMELSIRMTSANPYQIRDKAFIASIRKESMNIVNNVSQEIQNFRIEGVPNELVTNKEKKGLTHATS